MTVCKPEECLFLKEFYKVPNRPYSVNREGCVFDYSNLKVVDRTTEKFGEYKHIGKTHAHVLVAETFLGKPVNSEFKLTVNHKDGRKWNNVVDNLEWTTHSGNSIHAYMSDLRQDNVKLKSLNVFTGQIVKHYSLSECARHFKVNPSRVHGYLKRKRINVLFLGRALLVRDNEEFPEKAVYEYWLTDSLSTDFAVINNKIGQVTLVNKITDVASILELSVNECKKLIKKMDEQDSVKLTYSDFTLTRPTFSFEHEWKAEKIEKREKKINHFVRPIRPPEKIKVEDLVSGEIWELNSCEDLAVMLGISKNTLQAHISRHNGIWKNKLKVTYLRSF